MTPDVGARKLVFVALVANKGKVQELTYDLVTGAEVKTAHVSASSR